MKERDQWSEEEKRVFRAGYRRTGSFLPFRAPKGPEWTEQEIQRMKEIQQARELASEKRLASDHFNPQPLAGELGRDGLVWEHQQGFFSGKQDVERELGFQMDTAHLSPAEHQKRRDERTRDERAGDWTMIGVLALLT